MVAQTAMLFPELMFSIDDSDDEATVIALDTRPRHAADALLARRAAACAALLGAEGELGQCVQEHEAGGPKLAQLLMQWVASPEAERHITLLLSNARRNLHPPLRSGKPPVRAPLAPLVVQRRWSTGTTPGGRRRWGGGGSGSPSAGRAARRRRRSEPVFASLPWVAHDLDRHSAPRARDELSPDAEGRHRVWARGSAFDEAASEAGHWRRLSRDSPPSDPARRPAADGRWVWRDPGARDATSPTAATPPPVDRTAAAERERTPSPPAEPRVPFCAPVSAATAAAVSPTIPANVTPPPALALPPTDGAASPHRVSPPPRSPLYYFGAARLAPSPKSAGLLSEVHEAFLLRAGADGLIAPDQLLLLGMSLLDLPKAVAQVLVRRVQQSMRAAANGAGGGAPEADETPISWSAFKARYGRFDAGEEDKVRLFRVVRGAKPWLERRDVELLVWAVAETHPGLEFLRDATEFRVAYVETVTLRILWGLGGSGAQRISLQRWRRSALPEVLFQLDEEGDINLVRDYFSYNHFYVIWCLFWELDEDEDSQLHQDDLLRYGSYSLTSRVVERIWALRLDRSQPGMTYADFALFLLAEEDKQSPSSVQFWFHVLDYDGDGVVDTADMRYFYEEQQRRLEAMGEEVVSLSELLNEFNDMVAPRESSRFRLAELQRCGLAHNVLSALTNVRKYVAWEGLACEKAAGRASNLRDTRDWDLFADREYRRLVDAEEEGDDEEGEAPAEVEAEERALVGSNAL